MSRSRAAGFLVVQTPAGERYTRDGALQINNQGQLVTAGGQPVLGNAGPIVFQPTDKQVSIASDGNVTVLEGTSRIDSVRGRLRVVRFAQAQNLVKEGFNLYSAGGGNAARQISNLLQQQSDLHKTAIDKLADVPA
jgi:flagellar basal-body rod protein FlgF